MFLWNTRRWRRSPPRTPGNDRARLYWGRQGPTGSSRPYKDYRARPSTYSPALNIEDGRLARPPLPTLPGTIRRQGPAVRRTGRLGTLRRWDILKRELDILDGNWTLLPIDMRLQVSSKTSSLNWWTLRSNISRGSFKYRTPPFNDRTPSSNEKMFSAKGKTPQFTERTPMKTQWISSKIGCAPWKIQEENAPEHDIYAGPMNIFEDRARPIKQEENTKPQEVHRPQNDISPRVSIPRILFLSLATNSGTAPRGRNRSFPRENRHVNCDGATLKPFYSVGGRLVSGFPRTLGDAKRLNGKCLQYW